LYLLFIFRDFFFFYLSFDIYFFFFFSIILFLCVLRFFFKRQNEIFANLFEKPKELIVKKTSVCSPIQKKKKKSNHKYE
jgi:hypothetical protein